MSTAGADFLLDGLPSPKNGKAKKIALGDKGADGEYITPDEIEAVIRDVGASGKRVVGGLRGTLTGLAAIKASGLTGEALVILVENKCAHADNRNPISRSTVKKVLEALFRLGEYVR